MCEIDWGALATISVAFFVYRTWQTQKRKEVLSCIADNLYEDIGNIKFSLIFIHDTLFNLIMNNFPNLNQKERKDHLESTFQNFNSLCYRITIKLKQLNANENNEVYISLMESLDSVQKSLNQILLAVDSKYFGNKSLTQDEKNQYLANLNQKMEMLNILFEDKTLIDEIEKLLLIR